MRRFVCANSNQRECASSTCRCHLREVTSIAAFGLQWQPVGRRKQKANSSDAASSSAAAASSSPSSQQSTLAASSGLSLFDPTSGGADHSLVQFVSLEHASYTAPVSAELAHQQRLKQLPAALESNMRAMEAAEENGELSEIGALHLERKRLQQELKRLQNESPVGANIVEVRDTLKLPLGLVTLDGRRYCLQRGENGQAIDRRAGVMQIYTASQFKPTPLDELLSAEQTPGSEILTPYHTAALLRLFDNKQPQMKLLYSGKRDGMTPAAFHRCCDGKGPTLTVIRTHIPDGAADTNCIIGGWAGESWASHSQGTCKSSPTWLYSLGSVNSHPPVVSKYRATSEEYGLYCHSSWGPTFGYGGTGLCVSFVSQLNHAFLEGYELIDGYKAASLPLGGADDWDVERIEVWSCPL